MENVHEPPLHVTRFDCDTRYLVRSEHRHDVFFIVDLDENVCSCEDAGYRPAKTDCKHRRQARACIEAAKALCEEIGIPFDARMIGNSHR